MNSAPENEREARDLLRVANSPEWELPAGMEKALPLILWQMAVDKTAEGRYRYSERTRLRAAETLRRIKADYDARRAAELPPAPQLNVHVEGSVEEVRKAILQDAEYLEFLRNREGNGDPGDVRDSGEPGALEAGLPLVGDRSGADGGRDGQGAEAPGRDHAPAAREE